MTMLIGQEYTVIGWCKNRDILSDQVLLQSLLEDLCERIDMRALGSLGVNVPLELERLGHERFEDEGGATASIILSTSHASIHGWPERDKERLDGGFFWFTVGSCRSFKVDVVDQYIDKLLHVTEASRFERWTSIVDGKISYTEAQA